MPGTISPEDPVEVVRLPTDGGSVSFDIYRWGTEFGSVAAVYVLTRRPAGDADHQVLFVGETGDLGLRLRSHLRFSCMQNGLIQYVGVHPVGSTAFARELMEDVAASLRPACNRCWPREPLFLPGCPIERPPPLTEEPGERPGEASRLELQRELARARDRYMITFGRVPDAHRWPGSPRRLLERIEQALAEGRPIPPGEFRDPPGLREKPPGGTHRW